MCAVWHHDPCGCTCARPIHVGNDSGAISIVDVNRWDRVETAFSEAPAATL
jgi:hypothetical protein